MLLIKKLHWNHHHELNTRHQHKCLCKRMKIFQYVCRSSSLSKNVGNYEVGLINTWWPINQATEQMRFVGAYDPLMAPQSFFMLHNVNLPHHIWSRTVIPNQGYVYPVGGTSAGTTGYTYCGVAQLLWKILNTLIRKHLYILILRKLKNNVLQLRVSSYQTCR